MMVSFCVLFFPRDVLDGILDLIESVSEGFSYLFLVRYSVQGDRNLSEQKQQQESIPAGLNLTSEKQGRFQLSRTGLGNVLLKNKRFSADVQNIAQNYTTMRVEVTMQ